LKSKKRILIYSDRPNWAYDNIGKAVAHDLSDHADFYFDYCCCHLYKIEKKSIYLIIKQDIHRSIKNFKSFFYLNQLFDWNYSFLNYTFTPFWKRKILINSVWFERSVLPPWKKYDIIFYFDFYFDRYANLSKNGKRIIKGIYTDSFPPKCLDLDYLSILRDERILFDIDIHSFYLKYLSDASLLSCGSVNVVNTFSDIPIKKLFLNYIKGEDQFYIVPKDYSKTIVIGWTGNPNREFKNYYSVIVPAINHLIAEGFDIILKSRFEGPYDTLPRFYDDVHLIVIASDGDSGPSMFAEASLSGIPAISTKIGFPNIVIEDGVNGFFFDLGLDQLIEKITEIYFNRSKLVNASKLIRLDYSAKMGNEILLKNWKEAFELECAES
tara:strand:+ start:7932 stop:9077 length:1146 start_codon:yes stop_codon:yes gene_type:complete